MRKNPNCTQGCIEEKELKRQITELLEGIEIPEEFHNWAMKYLRSENEKEATIRNKVLTSQRKRYTECLKKIDRLIERWKALGFCDYGIIKNNKVIKDVCKH